MLINERENEFIKTIISLAPDRMKKEKLSDMLKEFYFRNFYKEHLYYKEKALEVLDLNSTLEEARKIIQK